jgi:hypothetical protein
MEPASSGSPVMSADKRMHQWGRDQRVSLGWHRHLVPGRFPETSRALQVMRGRSAAQRRRRHDD